MNATESSPNVIDVIAEEFVERFRRGERPAIGEYEARFPEQAEAIRELFPALVVMENLKPRTAPAADSGQAQCASEVESLGRLGDFRIVREIGRGGMGIVYEAVQESLGRKVALKVLPKQLLGDESRQARFDREARAAARLHHTNIVPVFGVGEESGLHFYAMQYIHGLGLDEVLRELKRLKRPGEELPPSLPAVEEPRHAVTATLTQAMLTGEFANDGDSSPAPIPRDDEGARLSDTAQGRLSDTARLSDSFSLPGLKESKPGSDRRSFWQSVARIGVQVSEALHYAHEQGVLHRDIKPSNLLLDTRGTVWVTDFGLAKADDQQDLTQTGDVLGTLRYMAPEMFSGKADRRSDVYSLGLTLYELLAQRPAFDEADRGRLIRLVLNESPPRLRTLDPSVPRDLETIVHKAIDREPSHRYASGQELADDLQRFDRGEPIYARPLAAWEKSLKWCRRNPVVASLSALVVVLLIAVAVGSTTAARIFLDQRDSLAETQRQGQVRLAKSLLDQARANRLSRRVGQRIKSLKLLSEATTLARELKLPANFLAEVRDEAIAAVALTDLELAHKVNTQVVGNPVVLFDADFRRCLIRSPRGEIAIRNIADGAVHCRLPQGNYSADVWFSPDGRYVAFANDVHFDVWDVTSESPTHRFTAPIDQYAFAFGRDGRVAIGHRSGAISIVDLSTGTQIHELQAAAAPNAMAFDPSGNQLAIGRGRTLEVFDIARAAVGTSRECRWPINHVAWHPDANHLAIAMDMGFEIDIVNLRENKLTQTVRGNSYGLRAAFDPSGQLLATSGWDHALRLWHWPSGELLIKTDGSGLTPQFSTNGRYLGPTVADGEFGYWRLHFGAQRQLVCELAPGATSYAEPVVDPSARLLFVAVDGGVCVWDLETGHELALLPTAGNGQVGMDREGLIAGLATSTYRFPIRRQGTKSDVVTLGPPTRFADVRKGDSDSSADGTVVAIADYDGAVVLRKYAPRKPIGLRGHPDVRFVAVNHDGTLVATGSHQETGVRVWNAVTGELIRELAADHNQNIPSFSPDGCWLLINHPNARSSQLWRTSTWKPGPDLGPAGGGTAFSPDGATLAVATPHAVIRLIDPETGRELARLEDSTQDQLGRATFSPDGSKLITCGSRVHVWDLRMIGKQLSDIGLDWELPDFAAPAQPTAPVNLVIQWGEIEVQRHLQTANEHLAGKRYAETMTAADSGLKLAPENGELWYVRGRGQSALKEFGPAAADFTQAIKFSPEHIEAHHYRGHARAALRQFAEAAADFEFAAQRKPDDPHLLDMLGLYRRHVGDYSGAIAAWRKSIELKPTPATQHDLARLLLVIPEEHRNADEGLSLAEVAVKADSKQLNWRATLGIAYYRLDRLEEATKQLDESAAAFQERLPAIPRFFQAMAWHKRGDMAKARQLYDQAVAAAPTVISAGDQRIFDQVRAEAKEVMGILPPSEPTSR